MEETPSKKELKVLKTQGGVTPEKSTNDTGNNKELIPLTPEQQILVEQGLDQVLFIARKMLSTYPPNVFELHDFMSWGTIGLIGAVRLFDSTRHNEFSTFAEHKIRGAIKDGVRTMDFLKREHRKYITKKIVVKKKLGNEFLREPSEEELAKEMGLTLEKFREKQAKYEEVNHVSIDKPIPDLETQRNYSETLVSNVNTETTFREKQIKDILKQLINSLTFLEKQIISLLFFEDMNYRNIAMNLKINEREVLNIRKRAIKKLKKELAKLHITSLD